MAVVAVAMAVVAVAVAMATAVLVGQGTMVAAPGEVTGPTLAAIDGDAYCKLNPSQHDLMCMAVLCNHKYCNYNFVSTGLQLLDILLLCCGCVYIKSCDVLLY